MKESHQKHEGNTLWEKQPITSTRKWTVFGTQRADPRVAIDIEMFNTYAVPFFDFEERVHP